MRVIQSMPLKKQITKVVANTLVLLLAIRVLAFVYAYNDYATDELVMSMLTIAGALLFFAHSFLLFPFLEQNEEYKYTKSVLLSFVIYILAIGFIWIYASRTVTDWDYVLDVNMKYIFEINELTKLLLISFIPLLAAVLLSFAYSTLIIGDRLIMPFIEFLVNVVVVSLLYLVSATIDNGHASFLLSVLFCFFYTNAFYITPSFLKKRKGRSSGVVLVLLITIAYILLFWYFSYTDTSPLDNLFLSINILVGISLVFVLSYVYGYYRIKIAAKENVFIKKIDSKESELQLLKSQVNPHFLFNTLNTLYSTALEEGATKTATSTAKLANLIRYMQEDINKEFIPLEKEIQYVQNYIEIQKLRCAREPKVKTTFSGYEHHIISPGLFIPFVENAFKYGINPNEASDLSVSVICTNYAIHFECTNTYNEDYKTYQNEQGFGLGIHNAKKRLELVYPKRHTFMVTKENNVFSVNIKISVSEQ